MAGHSGSVRKRAALVPALVLAGLIVAVIGATAALRLVGNSAFGPSGKALTQADVRRSLARPGPGASPDRPATPSAQLPSSASAPAPSSFATSGGTVFAACTAGKVSLTSWIPAQGYRTDGVSRGPARSAWVRFKSSAAELTVTASCVSGQPRFATSADDSGGGRGGGSRGGSSH